MRGIGPATSQIRAGERLRRSRAVRAFGNRVERWFANAVARVLPRHLMRNRLLFDVWERHGYHVTPVHFYEPIPDTRTLSDALNRTSELRGIDLRTNAQLELLREWSVWREEYESLPRNQENETSFHLRNPWFGPVDAEVLYCMIRSRKPRRIFEIGSGFSTLLAAKAVQRNADEGAPCELVAFEPYPNAQLRTGFPGLTRLVERRLQDVPIETFAELAENDVLSIDSSHVVATGSDVCLEYLEILPRLAPGVLVHVHDIFLPREYPPQWLLVDRKFWTEQYLLQAFLAFNSAFRVLWAGAHIANSYPDELTAAFSSFEPTRTAPGSFWMTRVDA